MVELPVYFCYTEATTEFIMSNMCVILQIRGSKTHSFFNKRAFLRIDPHKPKTKGLLIAKYNVINVFYNFKTILHFSPKLYQITNHFCNSQSRNNSSCFLDNSIWTET